MKAAEKENLWHLLVAYTMVGAASAMMGVMAVEWAIELFWKNIW